MSQILSAALILFSAILIAGNPSKRLQISDDICRSARIIGGYEVEIQQRPFQVDLFLCGGTIIDKKWVLSAAHCSKELNIWKIVKVGSKKHNEGQIMKVKRSLVHPNYEAAKIVYDFMLIELEEELVFSDRVKAVKLDDGNLVHPHEVAVTSGWGHIKEGDMNMSENLLAVNVSIVDDDECKKAYEKIQEVDKKTMVCAFAIGKDSCQGDSGGPLTIGDTLVGVVSNGCGCARKEYPGIYAKVSAAREWIKEIAGV